MWCDGVSPPESRWMAATRRFKKPGENLNDNVRFSFSVARDVPWTRLGTYLHQLSPPHGKSKHWELPVCYPFILIRVPADVQARRIINNQSQPCLAAGRQALSTFRQFPLSQLRFPLSDRRISCSVAVISVSNGSTTRHRIPTIGISRLHPLTDICRYLSADHGLDNEQDSKSWSAEWR
jgi:hypothetical protein